MKCNNHLNISISSPVLTECKCKSYLFFLIFVPLNTICPLTGVLDEQCCQFMSIYSCHDPLCMLIMTVLNNKTNGGYFTAPSSVPRSTHTIVRQSDNAKSPTFLP